MKAVSYTHLYTSDRSAGKLSQEWAARLGLPAGIDVAVGIIDAHAGAIGAGIRANTMVKILGTSTCDIVVTPKSDLEERLIPGISGQVDGSVIPGLIGLEACLLYTSGLSVLETAANSYVYALGDPRTATRRLNFSQSFNPFGALTGVLVSQIFVLSQLNTMSAAERAALDEAQLVSIQNSELKAVTTAYMILGLVMLLLFLLILFTKMPKSQDDDKTLNLKATFGRLKRNKNYVWGVVAQFFYVGAQIAVWSFIIRYAMQQLQFDAVIAGLGSNASQESIIAALRNVEPIAGGFYNLMESLGIDALLPRTCLLYTSRCV